MNHFLGCFIEQFKDEQSEESQKLYEGSRLPGLPDLQEEQE